ncbi:MAG: hypothetical protein Q4F67_17120, partial [Propionibacteriaceae bacterium]|nr:hypothetical protein [Propionibacteriaceae bacterium]
MDSNDATRTGQTAAAAHETGARPRIGALPGVPVPGQTHPHTLRTATHRWWKPVVGILGGVIAMFVLNLALVLGAAAVDGLVLGIEFGTLTPLMYGAGLVGLILLIPLTWLLVRSLHGQPFGYTFSVAGRMRWRYVLGVSPVFLVLFSLYMTAFTLMGPDMGQRSDNWWIYAVVGVLLLPFQSAAEEIFFR